MRKICKSKAFGISVIGAIIVILLFQLTVYQNRDQTRLYEPYQIDVWNPDNLDEFTDNIVSGGPSQDGIPPIENPKYISVSEVDFLEDNDVVFLVESIPVKVYPQKILVWHEIVNDTIDGEKVSITYCPLTGSAIGYKGTFDEIETTFGTSGKLVNSNLIMYDRATDSLWPQILGTAVTGSQKGTVLEPISVIWTRWSNAKTVYPDALVLSVNTGFDKPYGYDPYGSYVSQGNYYDSGAPMFEVMNADRRIPAKDVIIGIRVKDSTLAVVKQSIAAEKVANVVIADMYLVVLYDESLDTVRVYVRQVGENILHFEIENGKVIDRETHSEWTVLGESTKGEYKGTSLELVHSFDVMWFAWVGYYPGTEIYMH